MIINLRYTPDTCLYPFRDIEGKECIAILLYPETKKEKNRIHLTRWLIKNKFYNVLEFFAYICSTTSKDCDKNATKKENK